MFVARGTALVLLGLGYVMYFVFRFQSKTDYPADAVRLIPLVAAGIGGLAYSAGRISVVRHALESLADLFLVFLYIFFPLGIFGILIVVLRNLW
jgi:hypothetical protein